MGVLPRIRFSGPVTVFHERRLPETATPAGYAALIDAYGLDVPLPHRLACVGAHHVRRIDGDWELFTPRHAPEPTLAGHLTFALKYEGLDLAVLKRLFLAAGGPAIAAIVRATPTGRYARRLWFLYEWLTTEKLGLPDAAAGTYVDVLDASLQWPGAAVTAPRQRVRNNLPGSPAFCPLVRRTHLLEEMSGLDLAARARAIAAEVPADLLARTAAFLLLKDSRASYVIEGEEPPLDRVQRWGRAIGQAGRMALDLDELLRLQRIVIGDARFVRLGLRRDHGFVGEHERDTGAPLPDHISARPEDLSALIDGLITFDRGHAAALDPVIAAACLAFGFVFIHPFEDGNGRLHRYLIHHMLAARGFNPPGLVFPVSAAILARIEAYRAALEAYSARVLPHIPWRATDKGNVLVLADTCDFYRYPDLTPQAEFLYAAVRETVETDLPEEAAYLARHDAFKAAVARIVDMPERTIDMLARFLGQNGGKLSKRGRENEFAELTADEVRRIETAWAQAFQRQA